MPQLPYLYFKHLMYNRPTDENFDENNEIFKIDIPNLTITDNSTTILYKEYYIPLDETTYFTICPYKFQICNNRVSVSDYYYFSIRDVKLITPKWRKFPIFERIVNQIIQNMKLCYEIYTVDQLEHCYPFPFGSDTYKTQILTYLEKNDRIEKMESNKMVD